MTTAAKWQPINLLPPFPRSKQRTCSSAAWISTCLERTSLLRASRLALSSRACNGDNIQRASPTRKLHRHSRVGTEHGAAPRHTSPYLAPLSCSSCCPICRVYSAAEVSALTSFSRRSRLRVSRSVSAFLSAICAASAPGGVQSAVGKRTAGPKFHVRAQQGHTQRAHALHASKLAGPRSTAPPACAAKRCPSRASPCLPPDAVPSLSARRGRGALPGSGQPVHCRQQARSCM